MVARPESPPVYISICAGGGGLDAGISLALPGARVGCYVERDLTEAAVLAKGIEQGWLADAPVWSDLFSFRGRDWRGLVDGIVGGIPCQPHSYAGKRLGADDPRNLWPLTARLVWDVAPTWCFFENVPGILAYFHAVIRPDLQALGYEVEAGIFSAAEVGASHLRERLFWLAYAGHGSAEAVAHSERPRLERREREVVAGQARPRSDADAGGPGSAPVGDADLARRPTSGSRSTFDSGRQPESRCIDMGDASLTRPQGTGPAIATGRAFPPGPGDADGWRDWLACWPGTEPSVRRDADGLAARSDRLRVLGNGVVPLAAANALLSLQARMGVRL